MMISIDFTFYSHFIQQSIGILYFRFLVRPFLCDFFSRSFRFHFRSSRLFATQCLFPLKKNNINFPNPMKKLAPWNKVQNEKPARITQRRATKRRPDYNE